MRISTLVFILFIPAIMALGQDLYLFYIRHGATEGLSLDLLMEKFKLSALGYVWTLYDVEGYKKFMLSLDVETRATVDYILTQKALYVALSFSGAVMTLLFLMMLLHLGVSRGDDGRLYAFRWTKKEEKHKISFRSGVGSRKLLYRRK